jgi:hypothetical protein
MSSPDSLIEMVWPREMTTGAQAPRFRDLEGRRVSLALADGSRLDDVTLVSSGRGRISTLWLEANGVDVFVRRTEVTQAWEARPAKAA